MKGAESGDAAKDASMRAQLTRYDTMITSPSTGPIMARLAVTRHLCMRQMYYMQLLDQPRYKSSEQGRLYMETARENMHKCMMREARRIDEECSKEMSALASCMTEKKNLEACHTQFVNFDMCTEDF
jgi:hypothetical protein